MPEIVVSRAMRRRADQVIVHQVNDRLTQRPRRFRELPVTGVEPTLVALGRAIDAEGFEIACEDARRRRLTSVVALRAYLGRFAGAGRPGVRATRDLLDELDPEHPARSVLEVKTRRLLVSAGLTTFAREFPLAWNGRTYLFAFTQSRTVLETNGRRWHDDATDDEYDNEKWSVPGRHGFRIVFATWDKIVIPPTCCPS